jgi:hypothetical protein
MNNISLRYIESIYDINYKRNDYKVSLIEDLQYGDVEIVVMKYNKRGELLAPTEKQRKEVIEYFNENNY